MRDALLCSAHLRMTPCPSDSYRMNHRTNGQVVPAFILIILAIVLPACPTEDSVGCYWDASAHGNEQGSSFIAIDDETVLYLTEK